MNKTDVALECNVSRMTIFEWEKLPAFTTYLQDLLGEAEAKTRADLNELGGSAVKAIKEMLGDSKVSPGYKLAAAKMVLDHVLGKGGKLEAPSTPMPEPRAPSHQELLAAVHRAGREAYLGIVEEEVNA